jgi:hypothetical protein
MRLLLHRLSASIDVYPHLGLVLDAPGCLFGKGRMVRDVLAGSPAARAGVSEYDVIFSIDGKPWEFIHHNVLSDWRASQLSLDLWSQTFFKRVKICVRIEPEPFAPIADVVAAAARLAAERPVLPRVTFVNPRYADFIHLLRRRRARA